MGHADDHFARALLGRQLEHQVEHRHQEIDAFDREALLAQVRLVEEALERFHRDESVEQSELLLFRHRLAVRARLDHLPEPDPLGVIADVLDLIGDGTAVRRLQVREHVRECRSGDGDPENRRRNRGHDLGGQAQGRRIQRRIAPRFAAERIQCGGP